ncbi:hypothetical protein HanIR_Chr11g0549671 [Helianthus annuus]|nr:hypothetical protein HanIR_Chr11g0549671 [Helianthus annuus]
MTPKQVGFWESNLTDVTHNPVLALAPTSGVLTTRTASTTLISSILFTIFLISRIGFCIHQFALSFNVCLLTFDSFFKRFESSNTIFESHVVQICNLLNRCHNHDKSSWHGIE